MADENVLSIAINMDDLEKIFLRISQLEGKIKDINENGLDPKGMSKFNQQLTTAEKVISRVNQGFSRMHGTVKLIAIAGSRVFAKLSMLGLIGAGVGGIAGLLKFGTTAIDKQNKATVLDSDQQTVKALEYAGELEYGTGKKDVLPNLARNLSYSLHDYDKAADFAKVGLNQTELSSMPIEEALVKLLNAFQDKKIENPNIREAYSSLVGNEIELKLLTKKGAGTLEGNIAKGKEKYKGVDPNKAVKFNQDWITLSHDLEAMFQKIATSLMPSFATFVEKIEPLLEKVTVRIAKFFDDLTAQDIEGAIDKTVKALVLFTNTLLNIIDFLSSPIENTKEAFRRKPKDKEKNDEIQKKGVIDDYYNKGRWNKSADRYLTEDEKKEVETKYREDKAEASKTTEGFISKVFNTATTNNKVDNISTLVNNKATTNINNVNELVNNSSLEAMPELVKGASTDKPNIKESSAAKGARIDVVNNIYLDSKKDRTFVNTFNTLGAPQGAIVGGGFAR